MSKICGSGWLGGGDLRGWLGTNIGVPFGMGWSILTYGTITRIVTWLATSEACSVDRTDSWVVWWSWVGWSWWKRPHKGWLRWVVLEEHTIGDPNSALLTS